MRYLLLTVLNFSIIVMSFGQLVLEHKWKYADLLWESPQQKQQAIDSGAYNASMMFLLDMEVAPDGRIFIVAIREQGAPVSIVTVTDQEGEGGPLLRPYPDWSWYRMLPTESCEGIPGNVYGIHIKCNYLFVMDSGRYLRPTDSVQTCPPRILIFDLSTDKLVKSITIPLNIANNKNGTGFLTSITSIATHCEDIIDNAMMLLADTDGFGMVVYNASTLKFCRIDSDSMKPTGLGYSVGNQFYPLQDGISSMTVIDKDLYYISFAGNKIHKMEISKIAECSQSKENAPAQLVVELPDQSAAVASANCVIFFTNIEKSAVMCADTTGKINSQNTELIAQDFEALQFSSALRNTGEKLMIFSSNYHLHDLYVGLNISDINFRIFSMRNTEIQKQTECFSSCPVK